MIPANDSYKARDEAQANTVRKAGGLPGDLSMMFKKKRRRPFTESVGPGNSNRCHL